MNTTLDSWQLQVFVTVARTLNMRLAASELRLTTSGVSHCLKALENNLGCRLLLREPRGLVLSPAGELFLAEARQILERMESARLRIQAWTGPRQDHVRLAANGAIVRLVLAPALRELRESFPALTVSLLPSPPSPFAPLPLPLQQPQDPSPRPPPSLTWISDPEPIPGYDLLPIGEDDLRFYAHPLHPWVTRRKVDRLELGHHRLILPEEGSPAATRIRDYFREENLRLQPFIEVADESAAQELIRLDLGVGILPRWVAAEAVRQGHLAELPLGRKRLKSFWFVVSRRGRPLSLAESLLVSLCQKVFRELSTSEDRRMPSAIASESPESEASMTEFGLPADGEPEERDLPSVAF